MRVSLLPMFITFTRLGTGGRPDCGGHRRKRSILFHLGFLTPKWNNIGMGRGMNQARERVLRISCMRKLGIYCHALASGFLCHEGSVSTSSSSSSSEDFAVCFAISEIRVLAWGCESCRTK